MCTVSIVPVPGGLRLVSNRDESRQRPAALPPVVIETAGVRGLMPIDPEGGGTWVAASEAGLAFALLNVNDPRIAVLQNAYHSRGRIITAMLGCITLDEVLEAARHLWWRAYRPFRLIVVDGRELIDLRPMAPAIPRLTLQSPVMFTSSSLGDHLVQEPRSRLFRRLMTGWRRGFPERQDIFHAHRWQARPHLSVLMERADARTVSRTVVELHSGGIRMTYESWPEADRAAAGSYRLHNSR